MKAAVNRIRQVRQILRAAPDGLTVNEILDLLPETDKSHLSRILRTMPDAYIDRWVNVTGGRWHRAVWAVVIPPEDCPRPHKKDEYL
jgi:hypothetical protein